MTETKTKVGGYLGNGANAIIPLVTVGGLLTVLAYCFGIDTKQADGFAGSIVKIAAVTLTFIVPLLSAFIANTMVDKVGFVPGLIGGIFANTFGAGFIGGILAGLFAGYVTMFLIKYIKLPDGWNAFNSLILVPLIAVFVVGLVMVYIGEPIVKALADVAASWVKDLSVGNVAVFGLVAGLLVAFDIGGVFSKAFSAGAFALVGIGALVPQAAVMAAAMAAPLGLALATVIAKEKFTEEEKELGKASWLFGLSALTEGIIPFAASDPIRVIPSAMIGSAVTGFLTALFGAEVNVANGGVFALTISGAVTGVLGILVSIIVGAFVTAYLVKYLKK